MDLANRSGRQGVWQLALAHGLAMSGLCTQAADLQAPDEPQFTIREFQVEGNSLLSSASIGPLVSGFTGAQRRFADVEAARRALEKQYLKAGYSTVRVILPEQEVSAGTVRLVVQEMKLGTVEIVSAKHHDADNVRASVPNLIEGQVPNTVAIAVSLQLANENPSKQTHVLFRPDPDGKRIDALLRLEDEKPWKVFISLHNTGTSATGNTRAGIGYQNANLFNRDHVATVQYITSVEKPSDVSIYGLGYRVPLYSSANAIDVYAGYSDVNSGTVTSLFNVSGKGTILGARYTHHFTKTSPFEHKISAGLDYRAYENNITAAGTQLGANVTVHPLSLTWSGSWKGTATQSGGYATWLQNIPGGSRGNDADFAAARTGADAHYQFLRLGANLNQQLPGDWQLRLALDTQYSSEPLVSGEQFGLGGQDSVRGFAERIVNGDRGWRYGLEIFTPDIGSMTKIADARLRLSAFLEGGQAHRINAQPGETANEGIASTGLGMRFGIGKALSVRLDWGHVLDGGGAVQKGDNKIHGSIAYVF